MCLFDTNPLASCSHPDCNTDQPPRQASKPFHAVVRHEKATTSSKKQLPMNAAEPPPPAPKPMEFDLPSIVGNTFNRLFQQEVLGVLTSQSNLIVDIKCSHNELNSAISSIRNEISALRHQMDELPKNKTRETNPKQLFSRSAPTPISPEEFMASLTANRGTFTYKLQLEKELPSVIYKDRKLKIKVGILGNLPAENGRLIQDYAQGHYGLRAKLYAADGFPLDIARNGDDLLSGNEVQLINGVATFDNLSIHETSHRYPGGWFYFVISPFVVKGKNGVRSSNKLEIRRERNINLGEIQPLVIPFLKVRSKTYVYLKNPRTGSDISFSENPFGTPSSAPKDL